MPAKPNIALRTANHRPVEVGAVYEWRGELDAFNALSFSFASVEAEGPLRAVCVEHIQTDSQGRHTITLIEVEREGVHAIAQAGRRHFIQHPRDLLRPWPGEKLPGELAAIQAAKDAVVAQAQAAGLTQAGFVLSIADDDEE